MERPDQWKNLHVQIEGRENEGTFFVIEVVDSLQGKFADLKPLNPPQDRIVRNIPVSKLKYVRPINRDFIDSFCSIVVQGLVTNLGNLNQGLFFCNTIFKPYQFRPLLKFLSNPERRVLIADETGLGKTIEAGYILVNELASSALRRILVVCPANLQGKWSAELWHRFGLSFDIVYGKTLFDIVQDERRSFFAIASMDSFRSVNNDVLLRIASSKLDLLIIDEIHHMIGRGGDTLRRKFGMLLSSISERVIGITATPLHLELRDLYRILEVVNPGFKSAEDFDEEMAINGRLNRLFKILSIDPWNTKNREAFREKIQELKTLNVDFNPHLRSDLEILLKEIKSQENELMDSITKRNELRHKIRDGNTLSGMLTRTRKVDVGESRKRLIRNERVSLDTKLHQAYQNGKMVEVSERTLFEEVDDFLHGSFHYVHERQLSSCLPAIIGLLRGGLRGFNVWIDGRLEDVKAVLDESGMRRCKVLADKFGLLSIDSKWERLKEILKNLRHTGEARKAIVFTQWIPTISYFQQRKNEVDAPCYFISGQQNEETMVREQRAFQQHRGFAVLFATDVMSEGIDLQSADCVVNYDLPFNPQKVEQRIGRIDRIGQESDTLTIVNMLVEDSVDEQVFLKLLQRVRVFETAVGDLPDMLLEKADRESTLDEDEVIRALSEYEIRRNLLESDVLVGIDDMLDDEIQIASMKSQGLSYRLRWMALERMMFMLMGERKLASAEVSGHLLIFRELNEVDVLAIVNLMPIKERALVHAELVNSLDEEGTLKVTFKRGAEGLYLPFFHPLMQKAIEISYQSFFYDQKLSDIRPLTIRIEGNVGEALAKAKMVFLTEFVFNGRTTHRREWSWWAVEKKSLKLTQLEQSPLEEIWRAYSEKGIRLAHTHAVKPVTDEVFKQIVEHYRTWTCEIEKSDTTLSEVIGNAEARKSIVLSSLLNGISSKETDGLACLSKGEPRRIKGTSNIEPLKGNEVSWDDRVYKESALKPRIVAEFDFEQAAEQCG